MIKNRLFYIFFAWVFVLYAKNDVLRFSQLSVKDGLAQNTILGIAEDKYGFMWFGTWNGLCRYDGYTFKIYQPNESDTTSLISNRILQVYKDASGDLWISFSNSIQICHYNYDTDNFSRHNFTDVDNCIVDSLNRYKPFVQSVVETDEYHWQISAPKKELVQIIKKDQSQLTYKPDRYNPWALNDAFLTELYLDKHNVLWVGTISNGINKADTKQKPFNLYYKDGLGNILVGDIRAICTDKQNNIWVGTRENGYTKINRSTNEFIHYQQKVNADKIGFNINQVRAIYCDRLGFVWIGTKAGLRKFNPTTNAITDYTIYTKSALPNNWVFEITEDHNGTLWIGTFGGMVKYDRKSDAFIAFAPQSVLASSKVRDVLEDKNFNLWVATEEEGLVCLKRDSTAGEEVSFTPVHYSSDPNDASSISSNYVYSIDEDENGLIWLGTPNGLSLLTPSTGNFRRISEPDGLPDRMVVGVVCDKKGYAWASHKKGITRFDINTLEPTSYTYDDGLQDREFSENACYRDAHSGEIFFGGIHGINSFYPNAIVANPYVPKVYITALHILNQKIEPNHSFNGRVVLSKPIYLTDKITLTHRDRTIALEFAGLHFSYPKGNKYKYMLEGFDQEWIETDAANRTAYYSNLKAQTYVFKVMAANPDGVWNKQPALLKVEVLPPWWSSGYAYFAYAILLVLLFLGVLKIIVLREKYKHQIALEKLKGEKLEEFDRLKSTFFTHMAHELRTPLLLIIDPLDKLLNDKTVIRSAQNYLHIMQQNAKRLYELTNQLLDFRKMETGNIKISKSSNDICHHLRKIAESFNLQAQERGLAFSVASSEPSLVVNYDFNKLETVFYNLISNAFKYTPDNGEVSIVCSVRDIGGNTESERVLEVDVQDNGIGIKPEALKNIFDLFYKVEDQTLPLDQSYGIGLAFSKELIELHGGKIEVTSQIGKGSCFKVVLPYAPIETDVPLASFSTLETPDTHALKDDFTASRSKPSDSFTVLVVEDNKELRSYIASELSTNYVVHVADNGLQGFEKAVDCYPDLIISDVMMPGIDGIELCKRLKSDLRTSHVPVILLTARQSEEHVVEGYQTGADAYIIKPFSTVILNSRIKNLIATRAALRDLFGKGAFFDTQMITNNVTDEAFIKKAIRTINHNISETDFNSETLAAQLNISRALLYKKMKSLTNMTVHNFITTVRMNKAAEYLLSGEYTISEVAYKVGFTVVGNFSRSFAKKFEMSPTQFIASNKDSIA